MYKYMAFGLHILSDIMMEELILDDSHEACDVRIILGPVPDHINQALEANLRFETSKTEFLLKVDDVGKYLVSNGKDFPQYMKDKYLGVSN